MTPWKERRYFVFFFFFFHTALRILVPLIAEVGPKTIYGHITRVSLSSIKAGVLFALVITKPPGGPTRPEVSASQIALIVDDHLEL